MLNVHVYSEAYPHPYLGETIISDRPVGLTLPPYTRLEKPEFEPGFWPCLQGEEVKQIQDFRGISGYLDGEQYRISELGPLAEGWQGSLPPKPEAELLAEALEEAKKAIKRKRQEVEEQGFAHAGYFWGSQDKDECRLALLAQAFSGAEISEYRDFEVSEGIYITLDQSLVNGALAALRAHWQACFTIEKRKKEEVSVLQSAEEVNAWQESKLLTEWPLLPLE